MRSLRPTGGVEWVTGPGRRIDEDSPKDVSRLIESDLAWAPTPR